MLRFIILVAALSLPTACQTTESTWYEQRCINIGFEPNTPEFDACTERDRNWISRQRGGP